jgi:hypothetical protein
MDEELVVGIIMLARIHTGEIDFTCSDCDESRKEALSCSGVAEYPVYLDDEFGEFYYCPIRWTMNQVLLDWLDEYNYYQVFEGTAPRYGEHNKRFYDLTRIYKNEHAKSLDRKRNKPKHTEQETSNSLGKLRAGFKKR